MDQKKCVMTVGCFDLLHYGHHNLFNEIIKNSDICLIGVHDDASIMLNKNTKVAETLMMRINNINLYFKEKSPDKEVYIFPVYDKDPTVSMRTIYETIKNRYNNSKWFYMRGDDWITFPGLSFIKENMTIIYCAYTKNISSTQLRLALAKKIV